MFSFDRLKYSKIPIWENRRRLNFLTDFRDLLNDALGWVRVSPTTGQPLISEQQRTKINECKSVAHRMITLAEVKTRRQCARYSTNTLLELDPVEQLWSLEALFVSTREPIVVIEEAIGEYKEDQKKARWRTWNPLFWLARLIEWLAQLPIWLLSLVLGIEQEKAARSWFGRLLTILVGLTIWIFGLLSALGGLAALLDFLGWKDSVLHLA